MHVAQVPPYAAEIQSRELSAFLSRGGGCHIHKAAIQRAANPLGTSSQSLWHHQPHHMQHSSATQRTDRGTGPRGHYPTPFPAHVLSCGASCPQCPHGRRPSRGRRARARPRPPCRRRCRLRDSDCSRAPPTPALAGAAAAASAGRRPQSRRLRTSSSAGAGPVLGWG